MSVGLGVLWHDRLLLCEKFAQDHEGRSATARYQPAPAAEKKVGKPRRAKDSDAEEEEEEGRQEGRRLRPRKKAAAEEEIKVAGYLNLAADRSTTLTDSP